MPEIETLIVEDEKTNAAVEALIRVKACYGLEISFFQVCVIHISCGLAIAAAFLVAHSLYSITLVSDPSRTLLLIWLLESPVVILLYSFYRQKPENCSYLKAVGRGMLGLLIGALANAFGAVFLGAPVGFQYLLKTFHWSLLMSLFTCVPAACVFGSAWSDWQRIFANTKPNDCLDYMICIPSHGAVIGAWFGAFPMPLDWDRPWQEWPVCVTYGAVTGYLFGMIVSLGFVFVNDRRRQQHLKGD